MYHGALQVEASVAKVENEIYLFLVLQSRTGTAQDLALAERCDLWDQNVIARAPQLRRRPMQRGVELNRAYHGDLAPRLEIALDCGEKMCHIDAYVDENVQGLDLGDAHWNQTAVRVMYQHIATQCARSIIINTACAIRDVSHDECACPRTEARDDVGDGGGE